MRNWNLNFSTISRTLGESFYFTYEELKQGQVAENVGKMIVVFTLPMRNWNGIFTALLEGVQIVFTLPMRNWNLDMPLEKTDEVLGFYFTYEELKHWEVTMLENKMAKFLLYLWGIETKICLD